MLMNVLKPVINFYPAVYINVNLCVIRVNVRLVWKLNLMKLLVIVHVLAWNLQFGVVPNYLLVLIHVFVQILVVIFAS